jgi:hypothetical protein
MAHALYEDVALERNDAIAHSFSLQGLEIAGIPVFSSPIAWRGNEKAGGMFMPSNIAEAQRMLDVFTSVGARSFVVTKLTVDQQIIWGKPYSAVELREKLPAMVRTAAEQKAYALPGGKLVSAGENLIVRPSGPDVIFVQLDDLGTDQLERVRPASCIIVNTSPGNFQAWIAVSGVGKSESKEFVRRVRKAVGDVDKSASGAVRVAGTSNFKVKYWPNYPTVTITHAMPGRLMTAEELRQMGLLADAEPASTPISPPRVSRDYDRPWPSYQITLSRTRPKRDGTGPDRSVADYSWCLIALTGQKSIEDTIAKLMEVSENAKQRAARGDEGYARITVENAAATVACNYGKNRSGI